MRLVKASGEARLRARRKEPYPWSESQGMLRKEGDKDLSDTEGSPAWAKLTQKGIDVIWS